MKYLIYILAFVLSYSYFRKKPLMPAWMYDKIFGKPKAFSSLQINDPSLTPLEKKVLKKLQSDPKISAYLDKQDPGTFSFYALSQSGVQKLSSRALIVRARIIRLLLIQSLKNGDKNFCAKLWKGPDGILPEQQKKELEALKTEYMKLVEALPEDKQEVLVEIMFKAIQAEISGAQTIAADPTKLQEQVTVMVKNMVPEEIARFQKAATNPRLASTDDACWAIQYVLNYVDNAQDEQSVDMLARAMTAN